METGMMDAINRRLNLIQEFFTPEELDGIHNWIIMEGTDAFDEKIFAQINSDMSEYEREEITESDLMDLSSIGRKIDRDAIRLMRVRVANEIHRMRFEEIKDRANPSWRYPKEARIKFGIDIMETGGN